MPTSRQVRLAARPTGLPTAEVWDHTEEDLPDAPPDGHVLVEVTHLSLDPAMRGWMNDQRSYIPPVQLGDVMRAGGVGRVLASSHPGFAEGDHVSGITNAQTHAVLPGDGLVKVDTDLAPLPTYLGALGMTGLTAYFGLLDTAAMREGDTVLVSGAAGAVGSVVGQIARKQGATRVVGIAGGPEKCAWVTDELGFDACVDYKAGNLVKDLRRALPDGTDVYFDNVGGDQLDAALALLRFKARVAICGAISGYNATTPPPGPANYLSLLINRARMEGFIVFDFAKRYGEATQQLAQWYAEGALIAREDVVEGGIDAFGDTLLKLFRGENTGKLVLAL